MAITGNTGKLKKSGFWLLVAGVSPAVYFLSFHPATGSIGGIIFMFTAWLLPSLFLFSFSSAIVLLFNMTGVLRNAIAVLCLALFLGALPGLLGGLNRSGAGLEIRENIAKQVGVQRTKLGISYGYQYVSSPVSLKARLFDPPRTGGDAGCMCMYFKSPADTGAKIQSFLKKYYRASGTTIYNGSSSFVSKDPLRVMFRAGALENDGSCQLKIDILQDKVLAADLSVTGISKAYVIEKGIYGRDRGLFAKYFWKNSIQTFIHGNPGMALYKALSNDPLDAAISGFLTKALLR